MNALENLNRALAYVEANLTGNIDFKEVERLALCSEYHFRRIFSFLAGIPLGEYIRRRRLTLAAFALAHTDLRVVDVALSHGYSSPDAFTRAFQAVHGISPAEARAGGQPLKAYPRLTFQLTVQGATEMDYRIIEDKPPFTIAGLMQRVPLIYQGVNPHIAALWASLDEQTIATLKALSNVEPRGMISASTNFTEGRAEGGELDHYVGVATTAAPPDGLAALAVPTTTWAVFDVTGPFPTTLQATWARIFAEWFPTSGYQLAPGPEILWNEHPDTTSLTYHRQIWIPVTR